MIRCEACQAGKHRACICGESGCPACWCSNPARGYYPTTGMLYQVALTWARGQGRILPHAPLDGGGQNG